MRILMSSLLCIAILLLNGCTKDETNQSSTNGWKVTNYMDDGKNLTSSFEGYTFDFQSTGVVTATKGSEIVTGVWKEFVDSGRTKFVLQFAKSGVFEEISEDWSLVSKTDNLMKLNHNSGNVVNNAGDTLQFEK
jgi:hypothetical protein